MSVKCAGRNLPGKVILPNTCKPIPAKKATNVKYAGRNSPGEVIFLTTSVPIEGQKNVKFVEGNLLGRVSLPGMFKPTHLQKATSVKYAGRFSRTKDICLAICWVILGKKVTSVKYVGRNSRGRVICPIMCLSMQGKKAMNVKSAGRSSPEKVTFLGTCLSIRGKASSVRCVRRNLWGKVICQGI